MSLPLARRILFSTCCATLTVRFVSGAILTGEAVPQLFVFLWWLDILDIVKNTYWPLVFLFFFWKPSCLHLLICFCFFFFVFYNPPNPFSTPPVCMVCSCPLDLSPRATFVRKTDAPIPISHQLSVAPQLEMVSQAPPPSVLQHCWAGSCAGNCRCCEFMRVTSFHVQKTSFDLSLPSPSSVMFPELCREGIWSRYSIHGSGFHRHLLVQWLFLVFWCIVYCCCCCYGKIPKDAF